MTKTFLITGLLSCLCVAAFTQQNSNRHSFNADRFQNPDIFKKIPMEKFPDRMIRNGQLFSSTDSLLLSEIPGRFKFTPGNPDLYDNMPIALPQGHFPSTIIKPDSTVHYKLIIRNP